MIDLHTHTTASDGTYTPRQLVEAAGSIGLEALAISDHDNFAGYDEAVPLAKAAGLDLVCAIELSTRQPLSNKPRGRSVHLLGYFLGSPPSPGLRDWLLSIQQARRDRNRRLIKRLNELDIDISIEEVEAIGGTMTCRPHFAQVLLKKGYVSTYQEAFDEYLDEAAKAYVKRLEPSLPEGIERLREGNALVSLAHPYRLVKGDPVEEERLISWMCSQGLKAIEAYHSEHSREDESRYCAIAERYKLAITGGSDFHGDIKPELKLATGYGNLSIPREILDRLRDSAKA